MNFGQLVIITAHPIAEAVDKFFGTDLKNCAGCNQMERDIKAGMSFLDAITKRMKERKHEIQPPD